MSGINAKNRKGFGVNLKISRAGRFDIKPSKKRKLGVNIREKKYNIAVAGTGVTIAGGLRMKRSKY